MQPLVITLHPVVLALCGMFVVSVVDALGLLPTETPWDVALFYGGLGAGGGLSGYFLYRRLRG
ncbi:MAG: hypothetical protein R3286_09845 [Gammaproteobacteria bacterium]|nr:hypothetical protein [Gammaproteobacteria bacterium]